MISTAQELERAVSIIRWKLQWSMAPSEALYLLGVHGRAVTEREGFALAARLGLIDIGCGPIPSYGAIGKAIRDVEDSTGPLSSERVRQLIAGAARKLKDAARRERLKR